MQAPSKASIPTTGGASRPLLFSPAASRRSFLQGLGLMVGGLALSGCSNPEIARVIMEGPEGSGIMGTKFLEVIAVYAATEKQQVEAKIKAAKIQEQMIAANRKKLEDKGKEVPTGTPTEKEIAKLPPVILLKVEDERRKGEATVVAWDTRTSNLADTNVYDMQKVPPVGKDLTWQTRTAKVQAVYVGDNWPL